MFILYLKWVNQSTIQHIYSMKDVYKNALSAIKYIFLNNPKMLLGFIYDFNYFRI